MMKKVALYPNPARDKGLAITLDVARLCRECGVEAVLPEEWGAGLPPDAPLRVCGEREALMGADCLIALGGDGTILHAATRPAVSGVPILGVNLGRVGFMAELEADELPLIRDILAGQFSEDRRMMLRVDVLRGGESVKRMLALNDAVLTGGLTGRFISLDVLSDGQSILRFFGDGVIVATPTGSTAYSLSAGGPILEPGADSFVVTPLCPQALYARSIVFSAGRRLAVRPLPGKPVFLSVDGTAEVPLCAGDAVSLVRAEQVTTLIRVKAHSFYEKLHKKFGG